MAGSEKLWNAVEAVETAKDSRLARQIIVALPVELERAGWVELLTRYIQDNFVSQVMCADVYIHDTGDGNEVGAEGKSLQAIQKELPGLGRREDTLTEKEKQEPARYNEVSAQIASSDVEAVWDTRATCARPKLVKLKPCSGKAMTASITTAGALMPAGKSVMNLAKAISTICTLYRA